MDKPGKKRSANPGDCPPGVDALRDERLERLGLAARYARIGVWEYDIPTGILTWDETMFGIYGLAYRDPMPYEHWEKRVLPEDMPAVHEGMRQVLEEGKRAEIDFRIVRPDKELRHIHSLFGAVPGEPGAPARIVGVNIDVTDRVRAEEALRISEERWNFALEGSGEGVWDWDAATGKVFFSRRWKEMLGHGEEEIGDAFEEWDKRIHPDDKSRVYADLERHLSGGAPLYESEHRLHCKDGSYKWILDRGRVVERFPDGKPKRVIGTQLDLTARKKAEEERERSQVSLARAQQMAKLGSWEWDIASGAVHWSDEAYRIFGLTPGEVDLNYDNYLARVHPEDRQRLLSAIESAVDGAGAYDVEHRIVLPDRTVKHLRGFGKVHVDQDGKPQRLTGTVQDVSGKVLAENELRARDAMLQAMSEAAHDALIVIDSSDTIVLWNKAAEAMFGYGKVEVLGRKFHDLVTGKEHHAAIKAGLQLFATTGTGPVMNSVMEFTAFKKSGGEFPVERSVSAFRRGGRWYAVGSLRDITERKRSEARLKELATKDGLTGLNNRRHFLELAGLLFETAKRYQTPMSAVVLDVDHFKSVNDTFGHDVGDAVLRALARAVGEGFRAVDVSGRVGGEEFAIVMPETGAEQAAAVAERFRETVKAMRVAHPGGELSVTVSLGVAGFDPSMATLEDLLKEADKALYEAKRSGRDRVMVAK
jgi:diguanylate cyclase (GGDEF)-like protein/PAS domain S-box-containing protein